MFGTYTVAKLALAKEVEKFVEQFKDFSVVGRMVPKEDGMKMQTAEGDVISFDDLS